MRTIGIAQALAAALLFGLSVPLAQILLRQAQATPLLIAGLLYLGSGLGLGLWRMVRGGEVPLQRRDWPWLLAAVALGGGLAPVLLLFGLTRVAASSAALLLNFEAVFTALIAWWIFKENVDRRVAAGFFAIVAAGVLLSWQGRFDTPGMVGMLAIVAACAAWGIDNNLTRRIAHADAVAIAAIKGFIAGGVNTLLALSLGGALPSTLATAGTLLVGFLGYGVSLVLFVLALRHLGTARTAAYFGTAPFFGALLALIVSGQHGDVLFWIAAALMATGVWLHLSERHVHRHTHEAMDHTHAHVHDAHHRHTHDFPWDGTEPHVHPHHHPPLTHTHAHYPDMHHRHRH